MLAQQKLQILLDTRTTPDNNKTVREELSETQQHKQLFRLI